MGPSTRSARRRLNQDCPPLPSSEDALERRAEKVAPSFSRPSAGSRPVSWLKYSRTHVHYFDDIAVFFWPSRFVHPASAVSGFYFAHPVSWPKRKCKDYASARASTFGYLSNMWFYWIIWLAEEDLRFWQSLSPMP